MMKLFAIFIVLVLSSNVCGQRTALDSFGTVYRSAREFMFNLFKPKTPDEPLKILDSQGVSFLGI